METLYFNGKVRTITSHLPEEAVLVRDGRILDVGQFAPLLEECTYTKKIDLQGGCLLPAVWAGAERSPISRTVITLDDGPGGEPALSPREVLAAVKEAGANGIQIAACCFTDLAIDRFLSALEKANYPAHLRPVVLGGEMMEKDQLVLAKKLGVGVEFSVADLAAKGEQYLKALGDRAHTLCPCWSALKRGVPFSLEGEGGPQLLEAVFSAFQRETAAGVVLGRGERISIFEGLRAATAGKAWLHHLEERCGDVRPGLEADFLIFNRDVLEADEEEEQAKLRLVRVVKGGETVWTGPEA